MFTTNTVFYHKAHLPSTSLATLPSQALLARHTRPCTLQIPAPNLVRGSLTEFPILVRGVAWRVAPITMRKNWRQGKYWRFWYKTSHFEILLMHDLLQAPRNSGRDKAVGIIIVWKTSPPLILQIHSLHQVATDTPSHVPPRRRGIIIAIFHNLGTNSMVP